jgi:cytochrome oxidase Cu insertion factor (SCO1/SenC/PrrC family)
VTRPPEAEGLSTETPGPPTNGFGGGPPSVEPIDRAAALAEGTPGIPPNFIFWVLGAVLVLSVGGLIGERLFSTAGLNPAPTTTTTSAPTPGLNAGVGAAAPPVSSRSVNAPLASFMGVSTPRPRAAPAFTLTDATGRAVSVPARPPAVVVLTFFDASCDDICPVLAAELEQADADLGPVASQVQFVTVNTDTRALSVTSPSPALRDTGLPALSNWHMVSGPLSSLNPVWKAYGISISVSIKTGLEAHSDAMAFIDARGTLRERATPFANESTTGRFTLPPASVDRWGEGIATYAERLLRQ